MGNNSDFKKSEKTQLELEEEKVGHAEMCRRDRELLLIELRSVESMLERDIDYFTKTIEHLDKVIFIIKSLPLSCRKVMVLSNHEKQRETIANTLARTEVKNTNKVMLQALAGPPLLVNSSTFDGVKPDGD